MPISPIRGRGRCHLCYGAAEQSYRFSESALFVAHSLIRVRSFLTYVERVFSSCEGHSIQSSMIWSNRMGWYPRTNSTMGVLNEQRVVGCFIIITKAVNGKDDSASSDNAYCIQRAYWFLLLGSREKTPYSNSRAIPTLNFLYSKRAPYSFSRRFKLMYEVRLVNS